MAQYYQVLSQNDKSTGGKLRQFFQNFDENQTVQYVIQSPEEHQQTQQFPAQQVVVSSDQLMVVDGQPQQVILNQSQIAYQAPSYIIQEPIVDYQNQPQEVFYMTDNNQHAQPVVVEQSVPQNPEPIILNHQLNQQLSSKASLPSSLDHQILPPPLQQQQTQQQICDANNANNQQLIMQDNIVQDGSQISKPIGVNQQQQQVVVNPQPPPLQQKPPFQTVSPLVLQQLQRKNIRITPVQRTEEKEIREADSQDVIYLSDGTTMSLVQYRKILTQQKNATMQERLGAPSLVPVNSKAPVRKPRAPSTGRGRGNRGGRSGRGGIRINLADPQRQLPIQSIKSTSSSLPPQQQQNLINQSQYNNQQMHEHDNMMAQRQKQQNQYLIQSPKAKNKPKQPSGLPEFLHSTQIRHIIANTPVSDEYTDSIRMLVLLENGEQRLITFTLPKEACTIYEILDQVNVPYQSDTLIEVHEVNTNGINYVVTIGQIMFTNEGGNQSDEIIDDNNQTLSSSSSSSVIETRQTNETTREPTPEPIELPKLIQGQLAVCNYCGYMSDDFNKCTRCKRKLPENVKAVSSISGNKKGDDSDLEKKISLFKSLTTKTNLIQRNNNNNRKKSKILENETVVVSSDDEEEDNEQKFINKTMSDENFDKLEKTPILKEPTISDIKKSAILAEVKGRTDQIERITDITQLHCRTVRIGSYRFSPPEDVCIDSSGIVLLVPHPQNPTTITTIKIEKHEIIKVLVNFQKSLPVIFYYLLPSAGISIRTLLSMTKDSEYYYDSISEIDESHRRITLLPETFTEEIKYNLKKIYSNQSSQQTSILEELSAKEANSILMKTCPKELTSIVAAITSSSSSSIITTTSIQSPAITPATLNKTTTLSVSYGQLTEIKHLLTYPLQGRGRISINTEDYMCLGQEQFLNDVIIDFYLKYIILNLPKELQDKIHVFSTFFYNRLTTKPIKASRKSQPSETDPTLTPAQKRHARVKTWTKNINIFEKDYIIVPLNENCHWFLAIICFPSMDGTHTMDGQKITIEPKTRKKKAVTTSPVNNITITPIKKEIEQQSIVCEDAELSDKDEADGDDSELDSDDSEEPPPTTTVEADKRPPIKQPCILIFDSLAGASRSRVVATLRDYLTCEYKAKLNVDKIYTKDVIKGACPKVPQQTNFTDCGLYLLQYVEQFFNDPIKDYYIPISHLKVWFDEMTVTKKREDISLIIKDLMRQNGTDISILPDIAFPTLNGELTDRLMEEDQFKDEELEDGEIADNSNNENENEESTTTTTNTHATRNSTFCSQTSILGESPLKPSQDGVTTVKNEVIANNTWLKPDISEISRQSNKDTLSYLKAKRIIRHKNISGASETPETKKLKLGD